MNGVGFEILLAHLYHIYPQVTSPQVTGVYIIFSYFYLKTDVGTH